ncbi:hypothetical protein SO802_009123 [Lithocarpus litseifolius]|uniref:Uncharacterized protein n=1 Tax=Lithocarpus litseifolius TaxID=425828 RepID=A0AAW2DEU1_9ROSI
MLFLRLEKKSPKSGKAGKVEERGCKELLFPEMELDKLSEDQELILSIPVLALEEMEPEKRPGCCIYKVPQELCKFRKSALLEICPFLNMSWLLSCFPCFKCLEIMQPVLELKSFIIGDETNCVVRNLMALEPCHYPWEAYVCNYIVLLDHLINTIANVDLLVEKNVLVNWLGNNKAVATLINGLCQQILELNNLIVRVMNLDGSLRIASCTA